MRLKPKVESPLTEASLRNEPRFPVFQVRGEARMSLTVKLNDVVEALDSAMEEHTYYLDKRMCEIVLLTSDELKGGGRR